MKLNATPMFNSLVSQLQMAIWPLFAPKESLLKSSAHRSIGNSRRHSLSTLSVHGIPDLDEKDYPLDSKNQKFDVAFSKERLSKW